MFDGLLRFFRERTVRNADRRRREHRVAQAMERVVDLVNPRLRAVSRYRQRLSPVVQRALDHVEELAGRVPGPIRIDRGSWAVDPVVNALFGSVDRMRWVLTGPAVRRYVKDHPVGGDCYAVLAATPDVRQQLGMELVGEAIQRDVRQTTVSFSDHEVGLVGDEEEAVRGSLADAALELLVGLAEQAITDQDARIAELEERSRILGLKRKVLQARSQGAAFMLDGSEGPRQELQGIEARVDEVDRDLAEARKGLETLDDRLERLIDRMGEPGRLLGLEDVKVTLDRMNVVREGGGNDAELSFTRARRGEVPGRVVMVVGFPRTELLDDGERLRDVERYLG